MTASVRLCALCALCGSISSPPRLYVSLFRPRYTSAGVVNAPMGKESDRDADRCRVRRRTGPRRSAGPVPRAVLRAEGGAVLRWELAGAPLARCGGGRAAAPE